MRPWVAGALLAVYAVTWMACASPGHGQAACGNGVCDDWESPSACPGDCPPVCGDGECTRPEEGADTCPEDCATCAAMADVGAQIGSSELFFGYSSLGLDFTEPGCGDLDLAKEVIVSFTPAFSGDLVLTTLHPSTSTDTVIEVRQESCDGSAVECSANASSLAPGSRLIVPVHAGSRYVALVETADDETGVFALGLHPTGVCEGLGVVADISSGLLTGDRFTADTSASTSSLSGLCEESGNNPEARFTFVAPFGGAMVATTAHPDTDFDTVLYVREAEPSGLGGCDSPEAEIACQSGGAPGEAGSVLRFEVHGGRSYDLLIDGLGSGERRQGTATLTLGYALQSPVTDRLEGCSHLEIQDQFFFFVEVGQTVLAAADTVDAATAADLRLRVRRPDGQEVFEADDDVACTYPPPQYSCPQGQFTATESGLYSAEVYVGSSERCYDRSLVNYELTVTLNGAESELVLVKDE